MKQRFISMLALLCLTVVGAWPQDTDEYVDVTAGANNTWTFQMPDTDVELEVEYYSSDPFDLTVGESLHGSVAFSVGGNTVTHAVYNDLTW